MMYATTGRCGRHRRTVTALASVFVLLAGCTSHLSPSAHSSSPGGSVSQPVQPAAVYLQQARDLITEIAAAVSPHSRLRTSIGDIGPVRCTAPSTGLESYNIAREFDAPAGVSGASLIPAIAAELDKRGFTTTLGDVAGQAGVRASDGKSGITVTGSRTGAQVSFGVDTRCGTASAGS